MGWTFGLYGFASLAIFCRARLVYLASDGVGQVYRENVQASLILCWMCVFASVLAVNIFHDTRYLQLDTDSLVQKIKQTLTTLIVLTVMAAWTVFLLIMDSWPLPIRLLSQYFVMYVGIIYLTNNDRIKNELESLGGN